MDGVDREARDAGRARGDLLVQDDAETGDAQEHRIGSRRGGDREADPEEPAETGVDDRGRADERWAVGAAAGEAGGRLDDIRSEGEEREVLHDVERQAVDRGIGVGGIGGGYPRGGVNGEQPGRQEAPGERRGDGDGGQAAGLIEGGGRGAGDQRQRPAPHGDPAAEERQHPQVHRLAIGGAHGGRLGRQRARSGEEGDAGEQRSAPEVQGFRLALFSQHDSPSIGLRPLGGEPGCARKRSDSNRRENRT